MRIVYSPQATEDLEAYVKYVARSNPDAAARLAQRVLKVVDQLAHGAFEGPECRLRSGERARSWPVHPLRIYYRREADTLSVLRIYHQARRPIVT
ncbi:MAG TPA: type II toxin-antitoxin system RelE/ParE family toxin [Candidatus Limnocylindria bacterium]|nr:type II toxin-antitoxin system RelE/ParE family toxin [Candidatus Limnocylindria bacterium]